MYSRVCVSSFSLCLAWNVYSLSDSRFSSYLRLYICVLSSEFIRSDFLYGFRIKTQVCVFSFNALFLTVLIIVTHCQFDCRYATIVFNDGKQFINVSSLSFCVNACEYIYSKFPKKKRNWQYARYWINGTKGLNEQTQKKEPHWASGMSGREKNAQC